MVFFSVFTHKLVRLQTSIVNTLQTQIVYLSILFFSCPYLSVFSPLCELAIFGKYQEKWIWIPKWYKQVSHFITVQQTAVDVSDQLKRLKCGVGELRPTITQNKSLSSDDWDVFKTLFELLISGVQRLKRLSCCLNFFYIYIMTLF